MSSLKEFYVDFEVKFGKTVVSVEMPASASVQDLKQKLEEQTHVRVGKQRLLLNLPVAKEKQRDPPLDTVLRHLFPPTLVSRFEQHEGPVAQHLKVSAMLLGSTDVTPAVNVAATTEISRLVATTVEHDGKWYRCSYSKGYLRQTAYVCRTCVDNGRADPQHALCLACAEFCHGDHEVEEWGVRHYMRCDCCTEKCWRGTADAASAPGATAHAVSTADGVGGATTQRAAEVRPVHSRDIEQRTMRKRSRSTSPLTPKRSRGVSPMSGLRMVTVPPAEMPELDLQPGASARGAAADEGVAAAPVAAVSQPTPTAFPASPDATTGQREGSGTAEATTTLPPLPQLSRCAFVIDSKTKQPPVESVLPTNHHNRYPRDAQSWCYCKDPHPSDDPECGGIACLLCSSCYWSTHITKLFTEQYRRMPCYGDVLVGDTVAFKCNTCSTYVCTPCRYRCHKDHDIDPRPFVPSAEEGTDNEAIAGANFSCGCRGLCAIAESVPAELIDDPSTYALISNADAVELINNDVFTGFVCAYCMQEHPWLATEDPLKCYHGQLPPMVHAKRPVVACGTKAAPAPPATTSSSSSSPLLQQGEDADVFPYHGMLLPVNSFTEDTTCSCTACRAAYEKFAPRASQDATEMIMELHDHCDNCGKSVKDQQAFMCRTCEMSMEETFFICRDCNALRQVLMENRDRVQASTNSANLSSNTNGGGGDGHAVERVDDAPSGTPLPAAPVGADHPAEASATHHVDNETSDADGYAHNLSHEFIEDTFENLYALCGMQMLQTMDPEMQQYVTSNWNPEANQVEVANTLSQTLGQIPLQFSDEELREMASLNQRRKQQEKDAK